MPKQYLFFVFSVLLALFFSVCGSTHNFFGEGIILLY